MTKSIILCADDFGFNDAISEGIIDLVSQQRLSATSCMTNFPAWNDHISGLLPYRNKIDMGLHFNLLSPLPELVRRAYLRQLKLKTIETELQMQLDSFKQSVGSLPDYIDGHQHIHQLPVIRTALINVIKCNYSNSLPYIRIPSNGFLQSFYSGKALAIHLLGAAALRKLALTNKIPFNASFAGISDFDASADYGLKFAGYLKQVNNQGLIMCHPGLATPVALKDEIAKNRAVEYEFFKSSQFIELLHNHGVTLSKFLLDKTP